jgi:hypothetical protein
MVDTEQVTDLINEAKNLVVSTSQEASNSNIGDTLKDELYNSSEAIQTLLNGLLQSNNIITDQQLSELDEQIRLAKSKLLDAESKKSMKKIAIYGAITLLSFGFLWYLTKSK